MLLKKIFNPVYLYQVGGQLASQLLGFLLGIFLVRIVGVEVSGIYYSVLGLLNMSVGVINAGIKTNFLRNGNINSYGDNLLAFSLSNAVLFFIILPIAYFFFDFQVIIFTLIFTISFLMNGIQFYIYSLRVRKQDKHILLPSIIPITILLSLLFIFRPKSILNVSCLAVIAWASYIIFLLFDYSIIKRYAISIKKSVSIILNSRTLILTTLATQIYGNLDTLLINRILGNESAGLYKISISITMFVLPTIGILSFVYLSQIKDYLSANNLYLLIKKRNEQTQLILIISLGYVLFSLFSNRYIIELLYKITDDETVYASVILSFSVLFNALAMVQNYTLIGINKETKLLRILLFSGVLNLVLNSVFVSHWGLVGGACANTLTQLFLFVSSFILTNKQLRTIKVSR